MRVAFVCFSGLVLLFLGVWWWTAARQGARAESPDVASVASSAEPAEWPLTAMERLAVEGLDGKGAQFDQQVAAIVSDARTRQAIYGAVMQLQRESEDLAREAGKARGGVAVVRSFTDPKDPIRSSKWVMRP